MFWRTFSISRHGTLFMSLHHCDVWLALFWWPLSLALPFVHLSIWWRLSLFNFAARCGQRFPFVFRSFLRSFRECKGKNLFVIPKFYFLFFLEPRFRWFSFVFQRFLSSFAGCKGINLFRFCEIYFNFFFPVKTTSIYLQRTIPLPYLRAAKVRIVLTVANDWCK